MNRIVTLFNAVGVGVLVLLCVVQWQANRRLNLVLIDREKSISAQSAELAANARSIQGNLADLEEFRAHLEQAEKENRETMQKLDAAVAQREELSQERAQLEATIAAQKDAIAQWTQAVADRDQRSQEQQAQIQKLAADRNDAIEKFNDLAEKYNVASAQLNQAAEVVQHLTKDRDDIVLKYNALAEKYNALAQGAGATQP